jgi:predicted peptidase
VAPGALVGPPLHGDFGWTPRNFARIDQVVASAVRLLGGDQHRVLLTGVSYGGRGVWAYGAARPSMFAALVPLCASIGPDPDSVSALCCDGESDGGRGRGGGGATTESCCAPVWAFHGANDVRADVRNTDAYIEALRAQPNRPSSSVVRYSRVERAPPLSGAWEGHGVGRLAWRDESLWEWLLERDCGGCTVGSSSVGESIHAIAHSEL